ncbi:MAG: hypothetical protein WDW36_001221 [Sanguina aurantia]
MVCIQAPTASLLGPSGVPTYDDFRRHAIFSAERTDFCLDLTQLSRLVFECGLSMAGGIGLGDMPLLFSSVSVQGLIDFTAACHIIQILHERCCRVQRRLLRQQQQAKPDHNAAAARLPAQPQQKLDSIACILVSSEADASKWAKLRKTVLPGKTSPAKMLPAAGAGLPSSGSAPTHALQGLSAIFARLDPPALLPETLPLPACPSPAIAARLSGMREMYAGGETSRVQFALRETLGEWEALVAEAGAGGPAKAKRAGAAVAAAAVPAAVPGGGTGSPAKMTPSAAGPPSASNLPLEAQVWLLLMHGCCVLRENKPSMARRSLAAAESLCDPDPLGRAHPLHSSLRQSRGQLLYHEGSYQAAADEFTAAHELADLAFRRNADTLSGRVSAACLNNRGVCMQLLGRRSEACSSFRTAYACLKSSAHSPDGPDAAAVLKNLGNSLKYGFAADPQRSYSSMGSHRSMATSRPSTSDTHADASANANAHAASAYERAAIRPSSAHSAAFAGVVRPPSALRNGVAAVTAAAAAGSSAVGAAAGSRAQNLFAPSLVGGAGRPLDSLRSFLHKVG